MKMVVNVFFLICCWMTVVAGQDCTEELREFLCILNGILDNQKQIDAGETDHDFLQARVVPVDIPALRPDAVVLWEVSFNGRVDILKLCIVTCQNNKIHLAKYNFTDPSRYKPYQFDVKDLANITREDLHGDPDCYAEFEKVSNGTFGGGWFDCRIKVNGIHPWFTMEYGCNYGTAIIPLSVTEKPALLPYMISIGSRFPLVNVPKGYVCPCDK